MRNVSICIDGEIDDYDNKLCDDEQDCEQTEDYVFHYALDYQLCGTENKTK